MNILFVVDKIKTLPRVCSWHFLLSIFILSIFILSIFILSIFKFIILVLAGYAILSKKIYAKSYRLWRYIPVCQLDRVPAAPYVLKGESIHHVIIWPLG